jgi:hypothetical protein
MEYFRFWRVLLLLAGFLGPAGTLWPQTEAPERDPSALIGLTLESLLSEFGPPRSVYAVRGLEEWEDDVVFVYDEVDFYVYKDRVWQLGLKAAYGIQAGDSQGEAVLILGEGLRQFDDCILFSLPSRTWPLTLRLNLDDAGKISAIYIYRPDF